MYSHYKHRRRVSTLLRGHLESLEPRRLLTTTYTVDTLADENDGNTGPGHFSLREALLAAQSNPGADTIRFAAGLAGGTMHLSHGALVIQSNLTLDGGANNLTIDGEGDSGVLFVGGAIASIANLTITGGHSAYGAGLQITNDTAVVPQVTLTRMTFFDNHADASGGAIYSDEAKLTIIESTISQNVAGGAGGGMFALRGALEIRGSSILDNLSTVAGGGIICGGPVDSNDPSHPAMFFSNSTIANNYAGDRGGGVAVLENAAQFVNCTIVLNHANTSGVALRNGGGIYTDTQDSSTTLYNTIVMANRRGTGVGVLNDLDGGVLVPSAYNLLGSPSSAGGLTNGVNHNLVGKNGGTRPLAEVLNLDDSPAHHGGPTEEYTLVNDSPALDAGSNSHAVDSTGAALATDQRGTKFPRIKDGPDINSTATVDIGAVEMELPDFSLGNGASYAENAAPVLIAPRTKIFGDFTFFTAAELTVSLSANAASSDRITILPQGTGQGQVGIQGAHITYSNVLVGAFTPTNGISPMQIKFSPVSIHVVEAVLRRLAFSTAGDNPSPKVRTASVVFSPFLHQEETSDTTTIAVMPQNDAPTLDNSPDPTLFPIPEDTTNPAATLVSALLADAVNDPDNNAQEGMAVTVASNFNGTWQFTLNGGTTWQAMGAPTSSAARLLPSDPGARIRFLPNADFNGTVQLFYRAWDRTQGTAGGTLDTTGNTGGTKSLSTASENASLTVTPVNDVPQVALGGTIKHAVNAGPIILAPSAGVSDVDGTDFSGGELVVRIADGANASNRLTIGAGFTIDANDHVLQGSTIIGTRTANGFGTNGLIVSFNSAATPAVVQQLVSAITFKTVGGSAGQRKVDFTVSDGDGGTSSEATKTLNVS